MKRLILLICILFSLTSCTYVEPPTIMTQNLCESNDGYWNECGSPCTGTDAQYCIEVCVEQCECGGIAGFGCPLDYNCKLTGNYPDEMGVCIQN